MAFKKTLLAACKLKDMHVGIVWETAGLRKASGFYTTEILNLKAIKSLQSKGRSPVPQWSEWPAFQGLEEEESTTKTFRSKPPAICFTALEKRLVKTLQILS